MLDFLGKIAWGCQISCDTSNGGSIILGQVENEYHWNDPDYISWCGSLVKEVDVGILFLICNGDSANNTISAMGMTAPHMQRSMGRYTQDSHWRGLKMKNGTRNGTNSRLLVMTIGLQRIW